MVTEGQDLKVVDAKLVWNVDAEPLRSDYLHQEKKDTNSSESGCERSTPQCRNSGFKLVKKMLIQFHTDTDGDQHLAACILLLHPCTLGDDQLMATLVDHTGANCRRRSRMQA